MMMYLILFATFFKIGAFTFGGGYAMLPLIQTEVLSKGWMAIDKLMNFVAVSESTPGPFAVNMATYVGCETTNLFGAFCATLGVVLPSFIIILIVAHFYEKFKESRIVAACMSGLRPAVVGLIGSAAVTMIKTVFFDGSFKISAFANSSFYISLAVFVLMTVMALKKKHPILIICISAIVGIIAGYLKLI